MPAWKWGPDNARLKLATGSVLVAATGSFIISRQVPPMAQSVVLSALPPGIVTFSILRDLADQCRIVCRIIRAGGMSDIELPISSFQVFINKNSGGNIQIVVPDYSFAEAIAERANGSIALYKKRTGAGGIRHLEEIAIIPISSIRDDVGTHSKTITIGARQDG